MDNKNLVCEYCRSRIVDKKSKLSSDNDFNNECKEWLNNSSSHDLSNRSDDEIDTSTDVTQTTQDNNGSVLLENDSICCKNNIIVADNSSTIELEDIFHTNLNFKNVEIQESQKVHLGNVINIYGSVCISKFAPTLNQKITITPNRIKNTNKFPIVSRKIWQALPPFDPGDIKYLMLPAKYVIIFHHAGEEGYIQSNDTVAVRQLQDNHVKTRRWNDIAYHFLFGAGGDIFEGRGWNVVGALAFGYNRISIGLCLIGNYMQKLPPPEVLKKVQEFIRYGVEIGAIADDYRLLGHCQCSRTASPGMRLFEEIKTWDHWDGSVSVNSP